MTITPLLKSEFERQARVAFNAVFVEKGFPFNIFFKPWVKEKELLYEDSYRADGPLFTVISKIATDLGESGFYVSLLLDLDIGTPEYWHITLDEAVKYRSIFKVYVENIVFSEKGDWGIIFSPDCYAIIGGTSEFMSALQASLPDMDNQAKKCLEYWEDAVSLGFRFDDWLPRLLEPVYGKTKMEMLLRDYKILDV